MMKGQSRAGEMRRITWFGIGWGLLYPLLHAAIVKADKDSSVLGRFTVRPRTNYVGKNIVVWTSLLKLHGGGGYYEENPNYTPPELPQISSYDNNPHTLGDLEDIYNEGVLKKLPNNFGQRYVNDEFTISVPKSFSFWNNKNGHYRSQISKLQYHSNSYIQNLKRSHPELFITASSCVFIFALWQLCRLPILSRRGILLRFLQSYFVCSRHNIQHGIQFISIILSAISHMSMIHLLFNLISFLKFGPEIKEMLRLKNDWQFMYVILGSALSGSLMYLLFDRHGAGCMGLSAVTFSFMALYAQFYPKRSLRLLLAGIIPIQMTSEQLVQVAILWSAIGSLLDYTNPSKSSGVAHAAHLGGLIFGIAYYRLKNRR